MGAFGNRSRGGRVLLCAGVTAAASIALAALIVVAAALLFPSQLGAVLHLIQPPTRLTGGESASTGFGAAYRIAPSQVLSKTQEFDAIRDPQGPAQWDSSTTEILSRGLLERSIQKNSSSGAPDANAYQRYNYVVKAGGIRVAVWTLDSTIKGVCKSASAPAAAPSPAYASAIVAKDVMVNFFPEDTSGPGGTLATQGQGNVCHVNPDSKKETGVLDGHSKHFMLAQDIAGPQGSPKLASLKDYVAKLSTDAWQEATVDYAGEMIVDVAACSYIINNGSGTYRPNAGRGGDFTYLLQVAKLFEEKIGTPPTGVWDASTHKTIRTTKVPQSGVPLHCT